MTRRPLAERMRPQTLSDYVGQKHLVGDGAVIRSSIANGQLPSMILWGPPGVGKTTLARLIAKEMNRPFHLLSAVHSGVKDVRETIKKAESQRFFDSASPILFIDEIHRFSKSQQDSLLGAVESGAVTLIGATTENPSFEVINALRSRCQIYVLEMIDREDLESIMHRAITQDEWIKDIDIKIEEDDLLLNYANGDARRLLNTIELLVNQRSSDAITITDKLVKEILQGDVLNYDKTGDQHYDTISAFIKSVRGSNPDAAIYYLARMIIGGEDPIFICRRLIILAAEDIGLANPNALLIANACFEAVHKIGLPEGRIPLAEATIYLATSPKSNSAYKAIDEAMAEVQKSGNLPIPLHLRNAPTTMMKDMGYGKGYVYTHEEEASEDYNYLPEDIRDTTFYHPKAAGAEARILKALEEIRKS